ncbi:MAG: cytochrome c oxidase accessory protein CcoG [Bdellovibrionales bacterium]|nr:cytochrome c oxidase accessory protein CcoG [Bdellovibrionales bacterium]
MEPDFRETLYTVDKKGRRKWVYATLAEGYFHRRRQIVAYSLIAFYLLMPWVTINGRQGIHFDFPNRKFILFGQQFWATDSYFLFLVFGMLAFSLFFFTAVAGRLWCGWACPETVFLEFVFRPIERWIEGSPAQRKRLDDGPWTAEKIRKKLLKHGLCAVISWVLASSFLAYFIGREPLLQMMSDWPHHNPVPFALTLIFMGVMAFQFGWFREQFCTVLCPYARFQSVLMDSSTLVVGYDVVRGEPRGKLRKAAETPQGDCIDCKMCVRVCPTGIDIRNGVQLECISCTQCIDACDDVMRKVDKPTGLIRYDTEDRLLGKKQLRGLLRPRPFVYGTILLVYAGIFLYAVSTRELTDFQVLRGKGIAPYIALEDGRIANQFQVRVSNKGDEAVAYTFHIEPMDSLQLIIPIVPLKIGPDEMQTVPAFVNFQRESLQAGNLKAVVTIEGSDGFTDSQEVTLLGPDAAGGE